MSKLGKFAAACAAVVCAFGAFGSLPGAYREVEWIESTGSQCVDTGINATSAYGFVFEVKPTGHTNYDSVLSGVCDNFTIGLYGKASAYYFRWRGSELTHSGTFLSDGFTSIAATNGVYTQNGEQIAVCDTTKALGSSSGNIYVFNNSAKSRYAKARVRRVVLFNQDGTVMAELVPCYERTNPKNIGFYDCQRMVFLPPNAGSDVLIKGSDVVYADELSIVGCPENFGEVSPDYGSLRGKAVGESITCTVVKKSVVNPEGTTRATCVGYRLTVGDDVTEKTFAAGEPCSVTFDFPNCPTGAELEWIWESEYKVTAETVEHGSVTLSGEWFAYGETVTATATADDGCYFTQWTDGTPSGWGYKWQNPLSFPVAASTALTAEFVQGEPADVDPRYQRVAYIEATGQQWINLGVKENTAYGFEIGVKKRDDGSGNNMGFIICGSSDNFTFGFHSSLDQYYAFACGAHVIPDKTRLIATAADGFLVVAGTNGVMTVDGARYADLNTSKSLGSGSNNIWLFNCPNNTERRRASAKISFVKLYNAEGKLIHDYVPCYEVANPSNVGVYDLVDGAFIGNAGSGDPLIAGPDVYSPDSFRIGGDPVETGDVSPKYGKHRGYAPGESVTCMVAERSIVNAEGTMRATCVGYRLTVGDDVTEKTFAADEPCSVTFDFPNCPTGAELEWIWESEYKVTAAMSDHGSVALSGEWFAYGATVTATATANEGFSFLEWTSGVADAWSSKWKNPLTLAVTAPTTLKAEFVAGSQGRLPLAYSPVAYIEATGQQWIDLGVKENTAYGFEIGVKKRDDGSGNNMGFIICGSSDNFTFGFHSSLDQYYAFACGAHVIPDRTRLIATAADGFLVVAGTNGVMTVDGARYADLNTSKSLGSGSNNIWLFNCPNNSERRRASAKISFVKLYDMSGRLMFDGIPCLNEYGQPGFYNAVDGTFHGNIGNRAVDFETDLPVIEATYTWTGKGESKDWSDAANWSRSEEAAPETPGWYSTVVIPSGSWTLNLDRPVGVKNLDLSAADVTLKLTAADSVPSMIVHGDLTFGAASNPSCQGLWFSDVAVKLWGNLVASEDATEIPLHFVVPEGGYSTVPFEILGTAFVGSVRGRVYIASKSRALKVDGTTQVSLVTSAKDMVVENIALETMPKRNPEKDSSFVWSGVRSLGANLEGYALGLLILIQ